MSTKKVLVATIFCTLVVSGFASTKISKVIRDNMNGNVVFNRQLFTHDTTEPTNYSVIFKHRSPCPDEIVTSIEMESNANIIGHIDFEVIQADRSEENVIFAQLKVFNATKVSLTARIFALQTNCSGFTSPKSLSFVYAMNSTQSRNRFISLGQRHPDDHMIMYESKPITTPSTARMPSDEFIVNQSPDYHLTQIQFEFDSPTAILYTNSSLIGQNSFSAIVYDLSRTAFKAKMSVYGFISRKKLIHWRGIMNEAIPLN